MRTGPLRGCRGWLDQRHSCFCGHCRNWSRAMSQTSVQTGPSVADSGPRLNQCFASYGKVQTVAVQTLEQMKKLAQSRNPGVSQKTQSAMGRCQKRWPYNTPWLWVQASWQCKTAASQCSSRSRSDLRHLAGNLPTAASTTGNVAWRCCGDSSFLHAAGFLRRFMKTGKLRSAAAAQVWFMAAGETAKKVYGFGVTYLTSNV